MIRLFIANTLAKWFKQIGVLGWLRFRILRAAYYVFWFQSLRIGEWNFALQYLHPLSEWQKPVYVLDVGSTESLLIYELAKRGYSVYGLDQRPYQESIPDKLGIIFFQKDITKDIIHYPPFDYIVAISTIEHIGLGAYGDEKKEGGDRDAIKNIHRMLKKDGYFIITVPNKHLGTETGRGYSYYDFKRLIEGYFDIYELTERRGQLCAVLVKSQ